MLTSNGGAQIGAVDARWVGASADGVQISSDLAACSERRRRWTRALVATAIGYVDRGLGMLVTLFTVPVLLNRLGPESYGLWMTATSGVAMLGMLDLGVSRGLVTRVSREAGTGDPRAIRRSTSTAFFAYAAVTAGALVLFAVAGPWVPFGKLMAAPDSLANDAWWIGSALGLYWILRIPLGTFSGTLEGLQQGYVSRGFAIVGGPVGRLASAVVVMVSGGSLVLLVSLQLGFMAAEGLGVAVYCWLRHPSYRPGWRYWDGSKLRDLLGLGSRFLALDVVTLVLWQIDALVVAHVVGIDKVAPYVIAVRLYLMAQGLIVTISGNLWAAYGESASGGDWSWVADAYRRTTGASLMLAGLVAALGIVGGRPFLLLWVGPKGDPGWSVLVILALWHVVQVWTCCHSALVNGIGRPHRQVYSGLIDAGLNLALSVWLGRRLGLAGIALGSLVSHMAVSGWFLPWEVWRQTRCRVTPLLGAWRQVGLAGVGATAAGLLLGLCGGAALPWHSGVLGVGVEGFWRLAAVVLAVVATYLAVAVLAGLRLPWASQGPPVRAADARLVGESMLGMR